MVARDRRLERAEPFVPLRPAPRRRLIARMVIGPLLWLVALLVAAVVLHRTQAIELGILIAFVCLLVSMIVLSLLRGGRDREQRRYGPRR
jgi:peptidoglycan/LPS O-acetylase OafA/YrhL